MKLTEWEIQNLLGEMRDLNTEYLASGQGSENVREFLSMADNIIFLRFLEGRKYKPHYAWETLKRYAEVRFDEYPELFPEKFSKKVRCILGSSQVFGVLKSPDKLGRRVLVCNTGAWDPLEYSVDEMGSALVHIVQQFVSDKECVEDGVVYLQDCSGAQMKHAREFTFRILRRGVNVFVYSFPLRIKAVYFTNVPYFLSVILRMAISVFPKKLTERLIITSNGLDDKNISDTIPAGIMPKACGGELDYHEAVDFKFMEIPPLN